MSGLVQLLNSYGLPLDLVIKASFYFVAGMTLAFALLVVLSRNIFHVAVYLAMTLVGVACVYLYLDAEFLAVVQVLIYVGAIVTLFIFTVMLTADVDMGPMRTVAKRMCVSAFASLAFFLILVKVIALAGWDSAVHGTAISLEQLGRALMSVYALPFEVISLVSLAALIGAIAIGKAEKR